MSVYGSHSMTVQFVLFYTPNLLGNKTNLEHVCSSQVSVGLNTKTIAKLPIIFLTLSLPVYFNTKYLLLGRP